MKYLWQLALQLSGKCWSTWIATPNGIDTPPLSAAVSLSEKK